MLIIHLWKNIFNKINKVNEPVNKLILYFFLLGVFTFISNFFMLFLWGYSAMRQMNNLKIKYFELILNQDQNWFDENNSYEFSTKIQSQLEQIELGLGDRFSQIILMLAEILSGFTAGFMTSWKLTLILINYLTYYMFFFSHYNYISFDFRLFFRKISFDIKRIK